MCHSTLPSYSAAFRLEPERIGAANCKLLLPFQVQISIVVWLGMLSKPKNQKVAIVLALSGIVLPVSGLHKFYLGQPLWGALYLLLSWTPIPRVASAIEGLWYLAQQSSEFHQNFNANYPVSTLDQVPLTARPTHVDAIAQSLRHLDQLREDGLISEYEFEQKRRKLLDQIV